MVVTLLEAFIIGLVCKHFREYRRGAPGTGVVGRQQTRVLDMGINYNLCVKNSSYVYVYEHDNKI